MVFVNDYLKENDNDAIDEAIKNRTGDSIVVFDRRNYKKDGRDFWLLDRAMIISFARQIARAEFAIKVYREKGLENVQITNVVTVK